LFRLYRLLFFACLTLVAWPASAQYTRDTAANKKIDEAINVHYVSTDFEKAEGVLLGTINACGDKCSPEVFGRAWMYVGIVRGSGKNNQPGAKEAFQKAVAADPNVKLDAVLSTPETQDTFAAVAGGGGGAAEPAEPAPVETGTPAEAAGSLECTPAITDVETRRKIPVQCQSDEEIGADTSMRGYPRGRFRDRHAMTAQAELRSGYWRRVGAVAFAGAGTVAPTSGSLASGAWYPSVGAGLRYVLSPRDRTTVRTDFGIGRGSFGLTVGIGEAF
jgi:hypothetical protein